MSKKLLVSKVVMITITLLCFLTLPMTTFAASDTAIYNFETDLQGWSGNIAAPQWEYGESIAVLDKTMAFAGTGSVKVILAGAKKYKLSGPFSEILAGKTYTFHAFVPSGSNVTALSPFYQDQNWAWKDKWFSKGEGYKEGEWLTFSIQIPAGTPMPLQTFGIDIHTTDIAATTVYIDSVGDGAATVSGNDGGGTLVSNAASTSTPLSTTTGTSSTQSGTTHSNPKTSDTGFIPYLLLAVISAINIMYMLKRRKLQLQTVEYRKRDRD